MAFIGKTFDEQLHLHSSKEAFENAKALRLNQTNAEKLLWIEIRNKKCNGLKFRRQHPIMSFIADFYCHEKRLVIEVDGSVHDTEETRERDLARTYELENHGIKVLRFSNDEIIYNIDSVLKTIIEYSENLQKTKKDPSPSP